MAATADQQKLTAILLDTIEETAFPRAAELDRVERLISSREELEDYIGILLQKLDEQKYPHGPTVDRLERLVGLLQRLEQRAA